MSFFSTVMPNHSLNMPGNASHPATHNQTQEMSSSPPCHTSQPRSTNAGIYSQQIRATPARQPGIFGTVGQPHHHQQVPNMTGHPNNQQSCELYQQSQSQAGWGQPPSPALDVKVQNMTILEGSQSSSNGMTEYGEQQMLTGYSQKTGKMNRNVETHNGELAVTRQHQINLPINGRKLNVHNNSFPGHPHHQNQGGRNPVNYYTNNCHTHFPPSVSGNDVQRDALPQLLLPPQNHMITGGAHANSLAASGRNPSKSPPEKMAHICSKYEHDGSGVIMKQPPLKTGLKSGLTKQTSFNDDAGSDQSSSSGHASGNEKMDSLLTSEVSSSSAHGSTASPNDMVETLVKELDEDQELAESEDEEAALHHESSSSDTDNDSEELRDAQECQAPCHHKCKLGVTCTRHGNKILAKLKRRAEKLDNQTTKKQGTKRASAAADAVVAAGPPPPKTSIYQVAQQKHHQHDNGSNLGQIKAPVVVESSKPVGKPPPIKSVVPPPVPKNQQNGHEAVKELLFVDLPNTMPGTRKREFFARYRLYSVIGIGGGGTVYAGRRLEDGIPIAIKRVMRAKVKRWEKTRDGRTVPQEIALMIRCSGHMGVVTLYDWFETVDSFILVLERPESSIDLFDFIREVGPVNENIARHITLHVINAIEHLSMCGIVHRDIKDENVILDRNTGLVKLIDFGCGTNIKEGPYTEFSGTAEFYPPEWFRERRYWAGSATVWSLGVLLFDMLQGEIPFKNSDRILENRPLFKEPVSHEARNLIRWMLSNDYRKRPTIRQVLDHGWMKSYVQSMDQISSF